MGASGMNSALLKAKTAASASRKPKVPVKNLRASENLRLWGRLRADRISGAKISVRAQTNIGKKRAPIPCRTRMGVFCAILTMFPSCRSKRFTFSAVKVFELCLQVFMEGQFMQAEE